MSEARVRVSLTDGVLDVELPEKLVLDLVERFTDMFFQKINEIAAKFFIIKPKTCGISRCPMLDYEKTAMVINSRRTRVCQSTEFTGW